MSTELVGIRDEPQLVGDPPPGTVCPDSVGGDRLDAVRDERRGLICRDQRAGSGSGTVSGSGSGSGTGSATGAGSSIGSM
jgi:hypothetical protein